MSRLHVLRLTDPVKKLFDAVVHVPVPEGTNDAGIEWSELVVSLGLNTTALKTGKGYGDITEEEALAIAAGKVIEHRIQWGEDTGLDDGFTEDYLADAEGLVAGAVRIEQVLVKGPVIEKQVQNARGKIVTINSEDEDARTTEARLRYVRGVDGELDARIDEKRAEALSAYIDREIADKKAWLREQFQWFGHTVA